MYVTPSTVDRSLRWKRGRFVCDIPFQNNWLTTLLPFTLPTIYSRMFGAAIFLAAITAVAVASWKRRPYTAG